MNHWHNPFLSSGQVHQHWSLVTVPPSQLFWRDHALVWPLRQCFIYLLRLGISHKWVPHQCEKCLCIFYLILFTYFLDSTHVCQQFCCVYCILILIIFSLVLCMQLHSVFSPLVLCPLMDYLLITRVSGIPMLESYAMKKWGTSPQYRTYYKNTPELIPFFG